MTDQIEPVPDLMQDADSRRIVEDGLAPMKYLRHKRNRLAHGNESFLLGARHLPAARLAELRDPVIAYMQAVTASFDQYIEARGFLHPKGP